MRAAIAVVSILLPASLSAQRIPALFIPPPAIPAPLPPQAVPVAQDIAYRRMRVSVETYPMVSFVRSPGYSSVAAFPSWSTFGAGTRADYRLTRYLSATLDMTSSFLGGPALVETVEGGTRVARPRDEGRLHPFADLRVGYIATFTKNVGVYGGPTSQFSPVASYSHGFGGIGGAGFDYVLTPMWSLTSELSLMQASVTSHAFEGAVLSDRNFGVTAFRYSLGVRFNPVRYVRGPGEDTR